MEHEDPAGLVDRYLQLCEARNLTDAARLLAPNALIVFPGGRTYRSLGQMVAGATGEYRWVRKHRDRYFVGDNGDGRIAVTSLGTLYGEGTDGVPFDSIRYADVFVLRDGLITEQHVYNDLAFHDGPALPHGPATDLPGGTHTRSPQPVTRNST